MIPADLALKRLRDGNERFVTETRRGERLSSEVRRLEVVAAQEPFAIVLGCSDSRVPAEIVFDQGLGDLFVIRVAGNIVAPSQVESVEFAAERFGTRLVVVLGHSNCGAIIATLEELQRPPGTGPTRLPAIVDRIRPAVQGLLDQGQPHTHRQGHRYGQQYGQQPGMSALIGDAVRANIRASANHLRHGSAVLEQLAKNSGLLVVGAEYSLETGVVTFFDGLPADAAHP